jgi:hypothetical protein
VGDAESSIAFDCHSISASKSPTSASAKRRSTRSSGLIHSETLQALGRSLVSSFNAPDVQARDSSRSVIRNTNHFRELTRSPVSFSFNFFCNCQPKLCMLACAMHAPSQPGYVVRRPCGLNKKRKAGRRLLPTTVWLVCSTLKRHQGGSPQRITTSTVIDHVHIQNYVALVSLLLGSRYPWLGKAKAASMSHRQFVTT